MHTTTLLPRAIPARVRGVRPGGSSPSRSSAGPRRTRSLGDTRRPQGELAQFCPEFVVGLGGIGRLDEGLDHFTAGLVGNADDTGLFCGRMPEKGLLDLPGPHAIARGDDHVVLPGLEPQVPLVVLPDEVAGEIPLAAGLRRRRLGAVPELGENDAVVVGSDGDLTDLVVG